MAVSILGLCRFNTSLEKVEVKGDLLAGGHIASFTEDAGYYQEKFTRPSCAVYSAMPRTSKETRVPQSRFCSIFESLGPLKRPALDAVVTGQQLMDAGHRF